MATEPTPEAYERLAAIEHERWSHWQRYLHGVCRQGEYGALTIPANLVERWERQIATPYEDLTEVEKASDREQVDRYWPLAEAQIRAKVAAEIRAESLGWCMDGIGRHLVENCARIAEGKGDET